MAKYFENAEQLQAKLNQNIRWFTHWLAKDTEQDVKDTLQRWYDQYQPTVYPRSGDEGKIGVLEAVSSQTYKSGKEWIFDVYVDTDLLEEEMLKVEVGNRIFPIGRHMATIDGYEFSPEALVGLIEEGGAMWNRPNDPANMFMYASEELEKALGSVYNVEAALNLSSTDGINLNLEKMR